MYQLVNVGCMIWLCVYIYMKWAMETCCISIIVILAAVEDIILQL